MAYRGLFWPFYIWPPYGAYGYLLAASLLLDGYSLYSGLCVFPLSGLSSYWSASFSAVSCRVIKILYLVLQTN